MEATSVWLDENYTTQNVTVDNVHVKSESDVNQRFYRHHLKFSQHQRTLSEPPRTVSPASSCSADTFFQLSEVSTKFEEREMNDVLGFTVGDWENMQTTHISDEEEADFLMEILKFEELETPDPVLSPCDEFRDQDLNQMAETLGKRSFPESFESSSSFTSVEQRSERMPKRRCRTPKTRQRRNKWSEQELCQLWTAIYQHGNEWREVDCAVPTRTYHQIKDKGRRLLQTESWVTGKLKRESLNAKDIAKNIAKMVLERYQQTGKMEKEIVYENTAPLENLFEAGHNSPYGRC